MVLLKKNAKHKKEYVSKKIEKQIEYFKTDYDVKKRAHYKMKRNLA